MKKQKPLTPRTSKPLTARALARRIEHEQMLEDRAEVLTNHADRRKAIETKPPPAKALSAFLDDWEDKHGTLTPEELARAAEALYIKARGASPSRKRLFAVKAEPSTARTSKHPKPRGRFSPYLSATYIGDPSTMLGEVLATLDNHTDRLRSIEDKLFPSKA